MEQDKWTYIYGGESLEQGISRHHPTILVLFDG